VVLAGAPRGVGAAVRAVLVDGAAARRRRDPGDLGAPVDGSIHRLSTGANRWGGRGAAGRLAGGAGCAPRYFAAIRGRRPLRDPRHQLQPRHVPAPAGRRPAVGRSLVPAAEPGLSPRSALDRRRPEQGPRDRVCPRLQRPYGRGSDPRLPHGPRGLSRATSPSSHGRGPTRRPRLCRRLLLRPGRFQGDDAGPLPALLRPRAARGDGGVEGDAAAVHAGGADRGRQRLCVQLPRLDLAGWGDGDLGRRRSPAGEDRWRGMALSGHRPPFLRRPNRARARPNARLPQLRDVQPRRPRPRQPLRPDLPLRGPRHLALG
jgi:hypothetical protein